MKIAKYRTLRGAHRYAEDIRLHYPQIDAVAEARGFEYGVRVYFPNGTSAWAAPRPRQWPSVPASVVEKWTVK